MRKFLVSTAIIATAISALTACGNDSASPSTPYSAPPSAAAGQQADHNEQDLAFAQQMIPHHNQALEMAKLVSSRSTNKKVLDLAARITAAQGPEIQQLNGWVAKWSAMPGMTTGGGSMPGMDGGGGMPGMGDMGGDGMQKLKQAKNAQFDKMWTQMMTEHHQGAIDMAKVELAKGTNAAAKQLAQKIIDAQQAEITEMQTLA
jgi:uncharacterized protein (DUF305 family)